MGPTQMIAPRDYSVGPALCLPPRQPHTLSAGTRCLFKLIRFH
uniref:Uncharacterized protein n=1 Tax=Anguilla anguilla TaxID=7936 RepID=A0A0E9P7K6_ANGAN